MVLNSYPELFSQSVSCMYKGDKSPSLGQDAASEDFDQNHLENGRSFRMNVPGKSFGSLFLVPEAAFGKAFAVRQFAVGVFVSKFTH